MAKALAIELFDSQTKMIRIDMSEYMEKHSVSRLIGAPPGYIGHDQGGQLTEALRRDPYAVVLLDELEKAHPDVLNVLLQVLDDGRITDSQGRTVDCSNAVFIATSNMGQAPLLECARNGGRDLEAAKTQCLMTIRSALKPELLNRLDSIIVFNPLHGSPLRDVVRLQLDDVALRLKELGIELHLTDAAVEHVLAEAYDPELGARPLRRYLDKHVVGLLSRRIVAGDLAKGQRAAVDFRDQKLCVDTTPAENAASEQMEDELLRSDTLSSNGSLKRTASTYTRRSESNHVLSKRVRT